MDQHRTNGFLLYCLRKDSDGTRGSRLKELSNSDWEPIVQESNRHGVTPLLYHRLKTLHPGTPIPNEVEQRLRRSYLESVSRNMGLYYKLGKVLEILRHENIPVIALKGAHLAGVVYASIGLRPMNDVDLLVHKDDLMRAEVALLQIDFTPLDFNRVVWKDNSHFAYRLPSREFSVEVHWNFLPSMYPFNIDIDGQWERSRPAIIAGVEVSILSPEDLLLYLCLHASKHLFEMGLKLLYDIFEAIRHYGKEIDWKQTQLRSGQWGVEKCVYLALKLARNLLGASVPDEVLETFEPNDFDERFMAIAMQQIFPNGIGTSRGLPLSSNVAQLWGNKRLRDKINILLKTTFPSPNVMARMYPPSSNSPRIYFYYCVRIADLLQRYGQVIWRLLHRNQKMLARTRRQNEITALKDWLMSA